jgi:hypothetical protein
MELVDHESAEQSRGGNIIERWRIAANINSRPQAEAVSKWYDRAAGRFLPASFRAGLGTVRARFLAKERC